VPLLYGNTYYSVGGGFVVDEAQASNGQLDQDQTPLPYDFNSAEELLQLCKLHGLRVAELMMANEKAWRSEEDIRTGLMKLWQAMRDCVENGLKQEGTLPGGLFVQRRAAKLYRSLQQMSRPNVIGSTLSGMEWINLFALAVNEENAAGGRMVTAPTNGAAGIIPAVLHYYVRFSPAVSEDHVVDYLLAAAAIGMRRSPGPKWAVRAKWVRLAPWLRLGWQRYWAVHLNRWKTPPKLVWNITSV
jgi:L-serine dehydratase